jgi:branched-chain amino acid transport system substrate-binding protein
MVSISSILILQWFLVGCQKSPSSIEIGYIGSLSGKFSDLGTSARDGALLAVEEINSSGGINGHPVRFIIGDDAGDAGKAVELVEDMGKKGIRFIIGPFITASGTAVLPVVNRLGILTISATTMGENLEDKDDYYFKILPSTRSYGKQMGRFALENGYRRIAFISDSRNDPYCPSFVNGFNSIFEGTAEYSFADASFDSSEEYSYLKTFEGVIDDRTDGVVICASALDTAIYSQLVKKSFPSIQLFSSSWGISSELVENGGRAVEGMLFYVLVDYSDESKSYEKFKRNYFERFSVDPSYVSLLSYDVVKMLAAGLKGAGSMEPETVKETLLEMKNFQGVQADFQVDAHGDGLRPLILSTIKRNDIVSVKNR